MKYTVTLTEYDAQGVRMEEVVEEGMLKDGDTPMNAQEWVEWAKGEQMDYSNHGKGVYENVITVTYYGNDGEIIAQTEADA